MIIDTEKNWNHFKDILLSSHREGIEKLIAYLETTDIKETPASGKFHLCIKGGLIEHSLNVYNFAQDINKILDAGIDSEHIIISALLHDLCKVHYYTVKQKWDADHKEATGQWRKMDYYANVVEYPELRPTSIDVIPTSWELTIYIDDHISLIKQNLSIKAYTYLELDFDQMEQDARKLVEALRLRREKKLKGKTFKKEEIDQTVHTVDEDGKKHSTNYKFEPNIKQNPDGSMELLGVSIISKKK